MKSKQGDFFKFCPCCAGRLAVRRSGGVKRLICRSCSFVFYQNSKPTVSALFKNAKGQIMLVKRAIKPKFGYWDMPGGFLENGEDPIRGLKREIKEELGVQIKVKDFLGIYMDSYQHQYRIFTLNIIYQAKITSGKVKPASDVSEVHWFDKSHMPWTRMSFKFMKRVLNSHTRTPQV